METDQSDKGVTISGSSEDNLFYFVPSFATSTHNPSFKKIPDKSYSHLLYYS